MNRPNQLLYWLALLVSGIALVWSWLQMTNARLMARQSIGQLQTCLPLAIQLSQVRAEQSGFDLALPVDHQPGTLVASAYQQASISVKDPRISVRPGKVLKEGKLETRHLEMPILERIELSQLVSFLNALQNSEHQYRLDRIVLTPSPENRIAGTSKSTWNAECEMLFYVTVLK